MGLTVNLNAVREKERCYVMSYITMLLLAYPSNFVWSMVQSIGYMLYRMCDPPQQPRQEIWQNRGVYWFIEFILLARRSLTLSGIFTGVISSDYITDMQAVQQCSILITFCYIKEGFDVCKFKSYTQLVDFLVRFWGPIPLIRAHPFSRQNGPKNSKNDR